MIGSMEFVLPKQYVELEQEEMMYLDGGWKIYTNWWGISVHFTKDDCSNINDFASVVSIVGSAYAPVAWAAAIVYITSGIGLLRNGLYVNRNWAGVSWISF